MNPYYQHGDVTIYHGDCLSVLPSIGVSASVVVTDPPYAIPTIVAQNRETVRNVGDLSLVEATFRLVFSELSRAVGGAGRMFVFCDGVSYPVIFRAAYGEWSTALLVWDKGRIGMGREFRKSHELVLHAWKSSTPIYGDGIGRADILRASPIGDERLHPAEKPADLIEQLLAVTSGTILDPFMGSGTTLVAAKNLGRKAIGIEIEERYCEIAAKRLSQEVFEFPAQSVTDGASTGVE